jgi:hypothetical protein
MTIHLVWFKSILQSLHQLAYPIQILLQNYGVLEISEMTVTFSVIGEHCHGSIARGRHRKVVHVDEEKEWSKD